MCGIENVGYYIPDNYKSNFELKEIFEIDDHFIINKIGVQNVSRKFAEEDTSDLCIKAWDALNIKTEINKDEIDCVIVVTQNPDNNIPHVSAKVHGALELKENCACFDISLGCSGFVYALSVIESFMASNNLQKGLVFTADPYSKIIDGKDKNTALLFGDAAAVTLVGQNPIFRSGKYNFGTIGNQHRELICNNSLLYMNGRSIFDFAARYIPRDITLLLEKNKLCIEDVDLFLFHQGSKYIIDTLIKRLKIAHEKAPFLVAKYGNTVSSTIPIMLYDYLDKEQYGNIVISGFGVGLSWASCVLKRIIN
jgi:3-oxoacyl-[acyl-carrier-protein] synthase-3